MSYTDCVLRASRNSVSGQASRATSALPAILIATLVLRLAWVFVCKNSGMEADGYWYHARAIDLAAGYGYRYGSFPTAFFPVGYPFFLASLYTLFGANPLVGKLANVLLSVLSC